MAVMERRLQLLLDQQRYDSLANEAARTGRSVSALIREAIDMRYQDAAAKRAAAAGRFLELTKDNADEEPFDLAEFRASLERELDERYERLYRS